MEIKVNDSSVFELNETKESVIKSIINEDEFISDMSRRVEWVLQHKYEQCFKRLQEIWTPKLIADGATSLPTDPDAFAQLVFARQDYKSRKQLDLEANTQI